MPRRPLGFGDSELLSSCGLPCCAALRAASKVLRLLRALVCERIVRGAEAQDMEPKRCGGHACRGGIWEPNLDHMAWPRGI